MRPATCAAFIIAAFAAGCSAPPTEWHSTGTYRWRELPPAGGHAAGFSEVSARSSGVSFVNSVPLDSSLHNEVLDNGSGVALGDMDGDGYVDIFLPGKSGNSTLYRNLGGMKFEDVTVAAGLGALKGLEAGGATFADLDGDGHLDLLVSSSDSPLAVYINDGKGHFTERAKELGFGNARGGTSITVSDADGDGRLDVYVANYVRMFPRDMYRPQEMALEQTVEGTGTQSRMLPRFQNSFVLEIDSVLRTITRRERGSPDWYFRSGTSGKYTHVPFTGGAFLDAAGLPLVRDEFGLGLSAAFYDINGDGAPDLYVCNDGDGPDGIWLNDGKGNFRAASPLAIRATSLSSMGVAFADVDHDGHPDIFTVDMRSPDPRRRRRQIPPTGSLAADRPGTFATRRQQPHNAMLLSRGDGTFAEVAEAAGVAASDWTWTALFLDADLDGYEDLFVTNGFEWDSMDADIVERIENDVLNIGWHEVMKLFPALQTRDIAFRNNGDGSFVPSPDWGFGRKEDIGHGMAAADLDNDGYPDLVINRWRETAKILHNDVGAPRIQVSLRGEQHNTQGIGATIEVHGGPGGTQQKQVTLGTQYLSSSEPRYTFAMGTADTVTIVVTWRNGKRTVIAGARANREYQISERNAAPAAPHAATALTPLFTDVSDSLGARHQQPFSGEFVRQPLLPYSLSRLGPGVTWQDVDGDGNDDLIVPNGAGGGVSILRGTGAGLERPVQRGSVAGKRTSAAVIGMPGGKGGVDLLVSEWQSDSAAGASPVYSFSAKGTSAPVLPIDSANVGAMASADANGDGVLDLFVGVRWIEGRYPQGGSSHLYLRSGTTYTEDPGVARLLRDVGPVSAALFTDYDGDGRQDILVAPEWGTLRLLHNTATGYVDVSVPMGLGKVSGHWNGLATGDLNEDGTPDIVATGWGRNTPHHPTAEHPVFMYYGELDKGRFGPLLAQYDTSLHDVTPLASLARVAVGIPSVRLRIKSYDEYAHSTLRDALGPAITGARRFEAKTFDHTVFLSSTKGYVARSLPSSSQMAPAFYAGLADLDGDGHVDLLITQNFFGTLPDEGRFDAGLSMVLRGDGTGRLTPLTAEQAGLHVWAEARGAGLADYNGDGRVDVAIAQNGTGLKIYKNTGALPGLRVKLQGTGSNPDAIGATVRAMRGGVAGPLLELQRGSGYWSSNGTVLIIGHPETVTELQVSWPGGAKQRVAVPVGTRLLKVRESLSAAARNPRG